MESEFNDEPRFNRLAAKLIAEGSYAEAEALLEAAVQSMPAGWKPEQNDGRHWPVCSVTRKRWTVTSAPPRSRVGAASAGRPSPARRGCSARRFRSPGGGGDRSEKVLGTGAGQRGCEKGVGLHQDAQESRQELPWFVRVWKNPPTDPVTIPLLTLTEGLPSIPGPKTVGDENYSRIFDAFMERGWEGFEKEFDRIVLRSRADYEDVKRELRCEPIFRLKVHRRLAEGALGIKTADEIWEEIEQDREPGKPQ